MLRKVAAERGWVGKPHPIRSTWNSFFECMIAYVVDGRVDPGYPPPFGDVPRVPRVSAGALIDSPRLAPALGDAEVLYSDTSWRPCRVVAGARYRDGWAALIRGPGGEDWRASDRGRLRPRCRKAPTEKKLCPKGAGWRCPSAGSAVGVPCGGDPAPGGWVGGSPPSLLLQLPCRWARLETSAAALTSGLRWCRFLGAFFAATGVRPGRWAIVLMAVFDR